MQSMEKVLAWLADNWFPLVQSGGIIAGLGFTGWSLRRDGEERMVSARLGLAEHHRELWAEFHRRPDLARLLRDDADLVAQPVTTAEDEFLNVVIYHFQTCWELGRSGGLVSLKALRTDTRAFFAHPIPLAVWRRSRNRRDPEFCEFMEEAMTASD
jgi:hypothetical protein